MHLKLPERRLVDSRPETQLMPLAAGTILECCQGCLCLAEGLLMCRPPQRLEPFKREVVAQAAGFLVPLLTVSGSCVAADVALSTKHLAFGTVILGAQVSCKSHQPGTIMQTIRDVHLYLSSFITKSAS